jgi:hypothetical protein
MHWNSLKLEGNSGTSGLQEYGNGKIVSKQHLKLFIFSSQPFRKQRARSGVVLHSSHATLHKPNKTTVQMAFVHTSNGMDQTHQISKR